MYEQYIKMHTKAIYKKIAKIKLNTTYLIKFLTVLMSRFNIAFIFFILYI